MMTQEREIDPIIQALIDRLPPAGSDWPQSGRRRWLDVLRTSFELIYKDPEGDKEPT